MPETFFQRPYNSPLGVYLLVSSQRGMVCVKPDGVVGERPARWERGDFHLQEGGEYNEALATQLDAYFAGKLRQFSVPLDLRGTPFQLKVWKRLLDIPFGETRSYRQIAKTLGRPRSARPVGQAVGRNPVSIVVPCHRVIGSNGDLIGYGGGLPRKQSLLDLEATALGKGSG